MHQTYGSYVPSYLLIKIATDDKIENIRELNPMGRRIFVHEYVHFLQNVTGGFGMSQAWNTFDRSRQLISLLQKNNDPVIRLPIRGPEIDLQAKNLNAIKAIQGDYALPAWMNDSLAFIKSVNFIKDKRYEAFQPGSNFHFLNLKIEDAEGAECNYSFGESAVSEAMAFLMEKKFFGEILLTNFPYQACRLLGKHMKTDITENDEFLFALCDVSLLSPFPGRMFYFILFDMDQKHFQPKNGNDIIDYGIRYMNKNNCKVLQDLEKAFKGAVHTMGTLFNNEILGPTKEWFQYILDSGFTARTNNPYFMLQLYLEPKVFEGRWNNIIAQFGTPQIHNNKEQRSFSAPLELKHIESQIEPIWLLTLQQIHHTLLAGRRSCQFYEICEQSTNGVSPDERCFYAPWERAHDEKVCAYGGLWATYNLSGLTVK